MKRAVSISIGSSKKNKAVEVTLLGEKVSIERIRTDGDMEAAALKYKELDGTVDAFGVGGSDLGAMTDGKWYPFYSVLPMVGYVKKYAAGGTLDGLGWTYVRGEHMVSDQLAHDLGKSIIRGDNAIDKDRSKVTRISFPDPDEGCQA